MGVVACATHVQLGRRVALKFLREQFVDNQHITERFMREGRATAQLRGEHVCRVFDVAVLDGVPCLVMEMLDGIDLGKLLRRDGPIPIEIACEYVAQACVGIAEAHAAKIIHRDLKPGNLFLTIGADGSPLIKILDFGIAKAFADVDFFDLTHTDVLLGSPAYMSPEQIRSSRLADARSDVWSLGVILYELVYGKKPFCGEGIANLAVTIATEPMPVLPIGPPELDRAIRRCLEKDPANRYQDATELAAALAPFVGAPSPITPTLETMPNASNEIDASPTIQTFDATSLRPRLSWLGYALVALAAGAILSLLLMRGNEAPAAPRETIQRMVPQRSPVDAGSIESAEPPESPAPAKPKPAPKRIHAPRRDVIEERI